MKKLRLDPETLEISTFAAEEDGMAERGTVQGNQTSTYFTWGQVSCYGDCQTQEYETCWEAGPSRGPSCDYVCTGQSIGCLTYASETCG